MDYSRWPGARQTVWKGAGTAQEGGKGAGTAPWGQEKGSLREEGAASTYRKGSRDKGCGGGRRYAADDWGGTDWYGWNNKGGWWGGAGYNRQWEERDERPDGRKTVSYRDMKRAFPEGQAPYFVDKNAKRTGFARGFNTQKPPGLQRGGGIRATPWYCGVRHEGFMEVRLGQGWTYCEEEDPVADGEPGDVAGNGRNKGTRGSWGVVVSVPERARPR